MARGSRAGLESHAFAPSLPEATTTVTPSVIRFLTAASKSELAEPPRLRFATAGSPAWWFEITQLMPAMTEESDPDPWQSRTLTGTSVTLFATP